MPDLTERLAAKLERLPDRPGLYWFLDARKKPLYVGKASSLQARVRAYFDGSDERPFIQAMLPQVADLDWVVTNSEQQAANFEQDIAWREKPKYNVKLKDDKHYPYIRVNVQDPWPTVQVVRRVQADGARYFGPFPDATSVRRALDTVNRLYPHIRCTRKITGTDPRACFYLTIKRCPAPCIGLIDNAAYRQIVDELVAFLSGKRPDALDELRREMFAAAERADFERAAELRDRIRAVEKVVATQEDTFDLVEADALGLAKEGAWACVQVFQVRDRRLAGRASFLLENPEDADDPRILRAFITQYYPKATAVPREVIVPVAPEEPASTAAWLASRREGGVTLTVAADGDGRKLVDLAATNAAEALEQAKAEFLTDAERTAEALAELQEALELPNLPHRLECYDISNIQGTNSVASMVVFEGGRPKKSDYRKFKIKTVQGADDFASMAEVVRRRFTRALEAQTRTDGGAGEPDESFATVPDLVIVDGGKGQLAAAKAVLDELEFSEVPIVGLAKEREEIFRPGDPDPILLPRTSQGLYLVQRVRDEAHRFALGYHRKLRGKVGLRSTLDDLPGIGPKRKRELLKRFGSLQALRAASVEELAAVPGMTRSAAAALKDALS